MHSKQIEDEYVTCNIVHCAHIEEQKPHNDDSITEFTITLATYGL